MLDAIASALVGSADSHAINALKTATRAHSDGVSWHVSSQEVHRAAYEALRQVLGADVSNVAIEALCDSDKCIRSSAVQVLRDIGDAKSLAALTQVLEADVDDGLRASAAEALGKIGGEVAVSVLAAVLKERVPEIVLRSSISALGAIGGENSLSILGDILQRSSEELRTQAVHALESVEGRRAADLLAGALVDRSPIVRSEAAKELGNRGDRRALDVLMAIYGREDRSDKAATALGKIGDARAVPLLVEAHMRNNQENGPIVRALEDIMGRDAAIEAALLEQLATLTAYRWIHSSHFDSRGNYGVGGFSAQEVGCHRLNELARKELKRRARQR